MPRIIGFSFMIDLIRSRVKTVTRRIGWLFLKPGDELIAAENAFGLRKGEKVVPETLIRVVDTRVERLAEITEADCAKEGFPEMAPEQFVEMYCDEYNCEPDTKVNRIEFTYPED